jgi:bifunctional non-homologous end joining protein LigD
MEARYLPGRRAPAWLKLKHVQVADVLIGGWLPGRGWRSGFIGSLLIGVHGAEGLLFAGEVGSGLTELELRALAPVLESLAISSPPFTGALPPGNARHARWADPILAAEVAYAEIGPSGRLRHPVWRGLRPS